MNFQRGYIDKRKILSLTTQDEIFKYVFGYYPEEYIKVTSPFRQDSTPGCWFQYFNGIWKFIDFGNSEIRYNIKLNSINCFDAVQLFYNIPNFFETLDHIYNAIKAGWILKKKTTNNNIISNKSTKNKGMDM